MTNIRELILEILIEVTKNNAYENLILKQVLDQYRFLSKKDRSFIKRVCDGTIERRIEIDYLLNCFSKTPVEKMDTEIANILRSAVYQILYMASVPDRAACNEAVELTKKRSQKRLAGFVNGVLRNFIRNKEHLKYPKKGEKNYLSITYSMPQWLVDQFTASYGEEKTERILEDFLSEKMTCIRCNTAKITTEELVQQLEDEGVSVFKGPYVEECFWINGYNLLSGLKTFQFLHSGCQLHADRRAGRNQRRGNDSGCLRSSRRKEPSCGRKAGEPKQGRTGAVHGREQGEA